MINYFKKTFKNQLRSILISVMVINMLQAQEKKAIPTIEKIYVHTDRTTYTLGESLWYKAYTVFAYNNILFNESKVLYVELISSDSKIIVQNKTQLEDGLGHGDFKLTDSLGVKAGAYQLRAYTNYSRNFNSDFVFKKNITIIDAFNIKAKESAGKIAAKGTTTKSIKAGKSNFNVQFFPEGGSLLNDIESVVAFKAVDANGMPIRIQGQVLDSKGEIVSFFGSLHDGMGKFQLKPIKGEAYLAKVSVSDGTEIEVPLPKVIENGYLLSLKKINNIDVVTIKTNEETLLQQPDASVTLICTTRGVRYFEGTQLLKETTLSFELPKTEFPEGISQLTLYDGNLKPQSERLVYIENEKNLEVTLTTDKKQYQPLEKVTVSVSSKTKTGEAAAASFSLSCTDLNGVKNDKVYGSTISSYFLMESDIRGEVYNPSYYFDAKNPKRLEYLDLLLLTQGWRDFLWKKLPKVNDNSKHDVEKGFTVSGKVSALFGDNSKPENTVSLTLFTKNGLQAFNTITDSEGKFKFDNLLFVGKATMHLNSKNERGKSNGMIVLDTLKDISIPVDFKKIITIDTTQISVIKDQVYKKYVLNGIAAENILDEVEVIAKKKNYFSEYGLVDLTYEAGDEDELPYNDIYQMIVATIPGVDNRMDSDGNQRLAFPRFSGYALIMIDGIPRDDPNDLSFIRPIDVAKINAYKTSTTMFGTEGANGVIAIYLKEPGTYDTSKKVFHSLKQEIEGFYDAREFYSYNPEKPFLEFDNKETVRNTLFWNPYMHPDKTGEVQSSFFNNKVETNIKVSLEGITATGIPVVVHTTYSVQNN
ncbi:hypothetical protein [Mariniflexile sp.]|uniref:hypothetical protein n=1 Tax=Mariniflexile sp. TaxID=1979402 RepID=UPI00356401FC